MEVSKKPNALVWAGIAAAATGVIAIAVIAKIRERTIAEDGVRTHLRDIQEVLSDCYRKINEIEAYLPEVLPVPAATPTRKSVNRAVSNGSPVFES